ncbi:MAG: ACT domain-containing protein [Pseudomonadota bacterium]
MSERGVMKLDELLSGMSPLLDPMRYVFVSVPRGEAMRSLEHALMLFHEHEGTTLVLADDATLDQRFVNEPKFARITLMVHSSLHAVGLTAAVSDALATSGIPANMAAANFHDHVFVPVERATDAMQALSALSRAAQGA